eukprot:COSAG02_NODE_5156_length_4583_cov_2.229706_5_plen_125_part_00
MDSFIVEDGRYDGDGERDASFSVCNDDDDVDDDDGGDDGDVDYDSNDAAAVDESNILPGTRQRRPPTNFYEENAAEFRGVLLADVPDDEFGAAVTDDSGDSIASSSSSTDYTSSGSGSGSGSED